MKNYMTLTLALFVLSHTNMAVAMARQPERQEISQAHSKSTMGRRVRCRYDVLAGYNNTHEIWFYGGEIARVRVIGDGDTDLDLYVYDEYGNLIASDCDDYGDRLWVSWVPRWSGRFYIKIVNRGRVWNRYLLRTN